MRSETRNQPPYRLQKDLSYNMKIRSKYFSHAATAPVGQELLITRVSLSHSRHRTFGRTPLD